MLKKPLILLLTVIGIFFLSEKATACDKKVSDKEVAHKIEHINNIKAKSNCCDNHEMKFGHKCKNNCSHDNCFCDSAFQNFFFNQRDLTLTLHKLKTDKRKLSIYRHFFCKDISVSVWHPPKVA
jgi:hypothetical protein